MKMSSLEKSQRDRVSPGPQGLGSGVSNIPGVSSARSETVTQRSRLKTASYTLGQRASFWVSAGVVGHTLWMGAAPSMTYPIYAAQWHLTPTVTTAIFAVLSADGRRRTHQFRGCFRLCRTPRDDAAWAHCFVARRPHLRCRAE